MDYETIIQALRSIISEHNEALGPKEVKHHVSINGFANGLRRAGGTSVAALKLFGPVRFGNLGVPEVIADLLASKVKEMTEPAATPPAEAPPAGVTPHVVTMRNERDALETATDEALLAQYDHNNPGTVGDILARRAKQKAFLFFVDRKLDQEKSARHLAMIRAGRNVGEFAEIGGVPRKAYRVGDKLTQEILRVNPLYPDRALEDQDPGEVCSETHESWAGVSQDIRGVLEVAVNSGELTIRDTESARLVIQAAKQPDGLVVIRRRYPKSYLDWESRSPAQRPSGEFREPAQRREPAEELPGHPFRSLGPGSQGRRFG